MLKSKFVNFGWMFAVALALAVPSLPLVAHAAGTKSKKAASTDEAAPTSAGMSKEDQDKLKEHNKLRGEIKKVKYPASKADIVSHVKGIKPDDKKWFTDTLPEKTYNSADEVFVALGWPETPPAK